MDFQLNAAVYIAFLACLSHSRQRRLKLKQKISYSKINSLRQTAAIKENPRQQSQHGNTMTTQFHLNRILYQKLIKKIPSIYACIFLANVIALCIIRFRQKQTILNSSAIRNEWYQWLILFT